MNNNQTQFQIQKKISVNKLRIIKNYKILQIVIKTIMLEGRVVIQHVEENR